MDIHERTFLQSLSNPIKAVIDYVRHLGCDITYTQEFLARLVTDRREIYHKRINEKQKPIIYRVKDIVMGRVAVQSNT